MSVARRRWPSRVAAAAAATLTIAACGHRGPATPPPPPFPMPPQNVAYRQRGANLEALASYRLVSQSGRRLHPPVAPVLLFAFPRSKEDVAGWDALTRQHEFTRIAQTIALPAFADAAIGTTVNRTDEVPAGRLKATGPVVLGLELRDKSSPSLPSHRVVVALAEPPLPPVESVTATPEENVIRLAWTLPADERIKTIRIYRFLNGEPEPWSAWKVLNATESGTDDSTARYGEDVVYVATAGAAGKDVTVESEPRRIGPIEYRDVFPPLPPTEVGAFAETGRVHVIWYPGGSADEAGVIVERQAEGEDAFKPLAKVEAPESFYNDNDVAAGHRYRYRVTAYDKARNHAQPVGPTDWVEPRPPRPEPPGAP